MPEYLLSVHATAAEEAEQAGADPADIERLYAQVEVFNQKLRDTGAWLYANGLQPSETAAVVDAAGGSVSVVPGSRGTASHRLGGFWVVRADSRQAALELAAAASAACEGPVEVRPFQIEPGPG